MRRFLAILAAWLIASPAVALPVEPVVGSGVFTTVAGATYTGPGDITTFTAWYGFRAYSAAAASGGTLAANLRNTVSNEQCDFGVVAAGGLGVAHNCTITSNGVSLATFCTSGCAVTKLYDQTGDGWDVVQATAADQPTLVISCINSLPCAQYTTGNTMFLNSSSNITPASGVVSFATVGERTTSTTNSVGFVHENGAIGTNNKIGTTGGSVGSWTLSGGSSGSITATASDAAAHSSTSVINGASSVLAIDGTETTGTAGGNTTAGVVALFSNTTTAVTQQEAEGGLADNTAFSGTVRTNLCHNMRLYYGTTGSC